MSGVIQQAFRADVGGPFLPRIDASFSVPPASILFIGL